MKREFHILLVWAQTIFQNMELNPGGGSLGQRDQQKSVMVDLFKIDFINIFKHYQKKM